MNEGELMAKFRACEEPTESLPFERLGLAQVALDWIREGQAFAAACTQ